MASENHVGTPNHHHKEQQPKWQLADDLVGGTRSMRARGMDYLPKGKGESINKYEARLNRTFLYGSYAKTLGNLVAMPFGKPAMHNQEDSQRDAREAALDVSCDREGTTIPRFARRRLAALLAKGKTGFMVDYPQVPEGATAQDQANRQYRPYFTEVKPEQIIGWKWGHDPVTEARVLAELRIKSIVQENPGLPEWEQGDPIEQVDVWTPSEKTTWRKTEDDFKIYARVPYTLGYIPFVYRAHNHRDNDPLAGEAPLEPLAMLSVEHWQSTSDQRDILHTARIPILFGSGLDEGIPNQIDSGQFLWSENESATLAYVEINGKAIEAGRQDLQDIEARQEAMGVELLVKRDNETATKIRQNHQGQTCQLQDTVAQVEDMLQDGYRIAGEWLGKEFSTRWTFHRDFGIEAREHQDLEVLLKSRMANEISQETYLKELARRTIVQDLDVEEEIARLKATGLDLPG